jgi:hypothetical protein
MARKSRTERGSDSSAGGAERDYAQPSNHPMDKFRALAKRLVKVPRVELQAKQEQYRNSRKKAD